MGQMQNEQMVVVVQMKKFQETDKGARNEKFFFKAHSKGVGKLQRCNHQWGVPKVIDKKRN